MFQKIKLFPSESENNSQHPSIEQLIFYCLSFQKLADPQIRKCKLHANIVLCRGLFFFINWLVSL